MDKSNTILLIVDIQEKLIKSITSKNELISNIRKLIKASRILELEIIYSEQNAKKLGNTIKEIQPIELDSIYDKMSFSCLNCEGLKQQLYRSNKKNIILVGIETHICVLQTCLDLLSNKFNTYLVLDAISSRKSIDHDTAIKRLESAGAFLTTAETTIFELCRTADRKEFKAISTIIKGNDI